ncbi:MAG: hypothetical protein GEV10_06425 [Streptosporangiales bacterium]|nr:hypothetical protein [Streptosporangiales bacterium]
MMELVHPVYLDVPMLISFLAALQDGISFENNIIQEVQSDKATDGEIGAKVGVPTIFSLFGLNADGRYKRHSGAAQRTETHVVRQHTEASLFNHLRHTLTQEGRVTLVSDPTELPSLKPGQLVELTGAVLGNPLAKVLDLMYAIAPFLGLDLSEEETPSQAVPQDRAARRRAQREQTRATQPPTTDDDSEDPEQIAYMLRTMHKDVEKSPIIDLVLQGDPSLRAVLTVAREYLPPEGEAHLLGGQFTVLGKITSTVDTNDEINLFRRTALGAAGSDFSRSFINDLTESSDGDLDINAPEAIVAGPALQILPLAIFV